jgi:DNA (cytosine-5)-methyltransferase 1
MPVILPSSLTLPLHELALFAGAGGGILGGKLLGWKCVCAVEYEPAARRMLAARQDDGCLEPFPIWDDVRTFDGKPWRGLVDVVSGGFPCQDISAAGKGAGLDGERSGLWSEMSRIIGEVRPRFALVENSPVLTSRGLGVVLGDLAAMGYDARWGVLGAIDAGAPHKRDRIWIVANATGDRWGQGNENSARRGEGMGKGAKQGSGNDRCYMADSTGSQDHAKWGDCQCGWNVMERHHQAAQQDLGAPDHHRARGCGGYVANANGSGRQEQRCAVADDEEHEAAECGGWWGAEPNVGRVAHGVASRVDRLRAIGNGQVPAVVRLAWDLLKPKK